ncbi:MAG: hypothetical protein H7Y06_12040, partial [Opitutaceae bacterium]|nr:hypothetical protein [Opitutaceae bacterium]
MKSSLRRWFIVFTLLSVATSIIWTWGTGQNRSAVVESGNPAEKSLPPDTKRAIEIAVTDDSKGNGLSDAEPKIPELERFARWLNAYRASASAARAGMEADGVALAKARRPVMKALIIEDPEQALALRLSPQERGALPAAVLAHLEREISGTGMYGVLAICNHADDVAVSTGTHSVGCLIEREARIAGETFSAHVYGATWEKKTQDDVLLSGIAMDKELA